MRDVHQRTFPSVGSIAKALKLNSFIAFLYVKKRVKDANRLINYSPVQSVVMFNAAGSRK
jgi:hypothetical protein